MEEECILPDEVLTPEELEMRRKGLALAARIEYLFKHDEGFRRWYLEGLETLPVDEES